jgi:hypothetical protein
MSNDLPNPTEPMRDLDWYAMKCGVPVEQIRKDLGLPPDDDIRRNSLGCAALDDIISHSRSLQSAMEARIRLAQSEDSEKGKQAALEGEEWHEPRDQNESYWKRERDVLDRIIHQARFARGHQTS